MSKEGKKSEGAGTPAPTKKPGSDDAEFFSGIEGLRLLKQDPHSRDGHKALSFARDHITKLILHGGGGATQDSVEMIAAKKAHFLFSIEQSTEHLPDYATLDHSHLKDITAFMQSIVEYSKDTTRSKPFNWVMIASPGEGKSHFISCVAKKLKDHVTAVLFNMASMRQSDDLESALDNARNVMIEGKMPLLFLDEFDCDEKNYSLLLPLLWDGKIEFGSRPLKLGRAVIVLAGSDPNLSNVLERASSMKDEDVLSNTHHHKLVDLFSRINGGVIQIPSFREVDPRRGGDRRIDKVCVAIALLRRKYGEKLRFVPACLLSFIYHMTFRYGARSIEHLIGLLGRGEGAVDGNGLLSISGLEKIFSDVEKIGTEGLVYHLINTDRATGIKEMWDDSKVNIHDVPVWCKAFQAFGTPTSWQPHTAGSFAMQMVRELKGDLIDGKFFDATSLAGIEPLHITQLWLDPDDGEWNHGNKDMRHVFFNLNTLRELLNEVIAHSKPPREVGRRMGSKFGSDFMEFLKNIDERLESIDTVIDHWCHFDISGGWGKWERVQGEEEGSSELHVRNNFLAVVPEGMKANHRSPFCPIMEGYIHGVLEEVGKSVFHVSDCSVEVEEIGCGCENPKRKPCRFKYSVQPRVMDVKKRTPRGGRSVVERRSPVDQRKSRGTRLPPLKR